MVMLLSSSTIHINNLPTTKTNQGCNKYCAFIAASIFDENTNLTVSYRILIFVYHYYGSIFMKEIQKWDRNGKFNILIYQNVKFQFVLPVNLVKQKKKKPGTRKISTGTEPGHFL